MPPSDEFKKALRSGDLPEAFMMAMGKATELNITTRVVRADGSIVGESSPAQSLHTRLDLLNGTIENEVGEEFLSSGQYQDLQHFHQQQVALGNRKIQENFQSLQQLFRLLVTLQQYNRLNNAEEPLDLAFLEVPSHILPTEKVITTLKAQPESTLEPLSKPIPSTPPTPPEPRQEVVPQAEVVVTPPVVEAPPEPQRPAPIPPKPMANLGAVTVATATAAAIATQKDKKQPPKKDDDDEPLNFLDSFAALDLDEERDPVMPLSDLEMDDWEAPAEISPTQRLSQNATTGYVPSLQDFDHDDFMDEDEAIADLGDLLGDDIDPNQGTGIRYQVSGDLLGDDDDDIDPLANLLEEPEPLDELDDLLEEIPSVTMPAVTEDEVAEVSFAESRFADIDDMAIADDLPNETLEGLIAESEDVDFELATVSLGQASPHAEKEAVDPDLESLLEEADAAHDSLDDLDILGNLESLPDLAIIETEHPDAVLQPEAIAAETVMAETSFNELLAAADAVTPEMAVDLLDNTLEATEVEPESPAADLLSDLEESESDLETEAIGDRDLLDFINQDWQSYPGIMEISSLDDDSDPEKALLRPLSVEELAELEDMNGEWSSNAVDDDWQPLGSGSSEALSGGFEAFKVDLDEDVQSLPLEVTDAFLPLGTTEATKTAPSPSNEADFSDAVNDDWIPLNAKFHEAIDIESLLPLELDGDDLDFDAEFEADKIGGAQPESDLEAIASSDGLDLLDMEEMELDLEADLEMPLSSGGGDIGMLDSVDPEASDFDDDDLDDDDIDLVDMPDMGDIGDDFGAALSIDPINMGGLSDLDLDDMDEAALLTDEPLDDLDDLDGFPESNEDFAMPESDTGLDELGDIDLDDSALDLTDDELDAGSGDFDDNWLDDNATGEVGGLEVSGLDDLDTDLDSDAMADLADPFAATDDDWDEPSDESLTSENFGFDADDEDADPLADLDLSAAPTDEEADNWLGELHSTSAIAADDDDDDLGLDSDLAATGDDDLAFDLDLDGEGLNDEVLNSIEELDQATANLISPDDLGDESILNALNATTLDDVADHGAMNALGELDDIDDFSLDGLDDSLDQFAHHEMDLSAIAGEEELTGFTPVSSDDEIDPSNWDDDLENISLFSPEVDDDAPIELGLDDDFAMPDLDEELDDEVGAIDISISAGADEAWENLTISADDDTATADWNDLESSTPQATANENWDMSDLDGLGDFDNDDLSGLADFDLEALESDDNDNDFDLFGNEEGDVLNPFFESKP